MLEYKCCSCGAQNKFTSSMSDTAPHAKGNEASASAARKIRPKLVGIRRRVYEYIYKIGGMGATGTEIAEALDILPYTAKPRCTELRDGGYIIDSKTTRKNDNGSNETVWIVPVGQMRML